MTTGKVSVFVGTYSKTEPLGPGVLASTPEYKLWDSWAVISKPRLTACALWLVLRLVQSAGRNRRHCPPSLSDLQVRTLGSSWGEALCPTAQVSGCPVLCLLIEGRGTHVWWFLTSPVRDDILKKGYQYYCYYCNHRIRNYLVV